MNLAGSLSSIVQAFTGAKGKFMRTPKVRDRTIPAFLYVVLPYLLVGFSAYTFKLAWDRGLWSNAIFAAINGLLGAYAIVAFIGIRNSLVDMGFPDRRRPNREVPAGLPVSLPVSAPAIDPRRVDSDLVSERQ